MFSLGAVTPLKRNWTRFPFTICNLHDSVFPHTGGEYRFCTSCLSVRGSVSLSITKSCAHFDDETAYRRDNASLSLLSRQEDPMIFLWVMVDLRGVGSEITCAHFSSEMADHRNLNCFIIISRFAYCQDMQDPILWATVDPRVVESVK
jgi:hypothetical protein